MEMHVHSGHHRRRLCSPYPPAGPCTGPWDPRRRQARHARAWIGIVVGGQLLAGCGGIATRVPSGVHQPAPPASRGSTAAAGASAFAPLTREIMGRLRASVTLPLMAPAGELNPFVVEAQAGQALGAWIKTGANGSAYWVAVGYCPLPAPWQTVVGRSCDGAIASEAAGFRFGGQAYPNTQAALAAVAPAAPPTGAHVPVALGAGVQGQEYAGGGGTVLWRDGDWHLRVDAAGCPAQNAVPPGLSTARALAAFLHTHALPATPGSVTFLTSCGDSSSASTQVRWAVGRDVYRVATSGYGVDPALRLAMAMRPYP